MGVEVPKKVAELLDKLGKTEPTNPILKKGIELEVCSPISNGSIVVGTGQANSPGQNGQPPVISNISLKGVFLMYLLRFEGCGFMLDPISNRLVPVEFGRDKQGNWIMIPALTSVEKMLPKIDNKEFKKTILFNLDLIDGG